MEHNWKNKGLLLQKGEKCDEITEAAFQIRATFTKEFQTLVTLEAEWAGMTSEWKFFVYSWICMRFGGILNYVRTHSRANRKIPTAFELHSSWTFSLNIEIDSSSNRDSPSNAIRMLRMLLECRNGPVEYLECS